MKPEQFKNAKPIVDAIDLHSMVEAFIMDSEKIMHHKLDGDENGIHCASNASGRVYTQFEFKRDKFGKLRPVLIVDGKYIELTKKEYEAIEDIFRIITQNRIEKLESDLDKI